MPVVLPLEKMSRIEKIRLMEALWSDLSEHPSDLESPKWHAEALAKAKRLVKTGKAKFIDWDLAKERIRRKVRKNL